MRMNPFPPYSFVVSKTNNSKKNRILNLFNIK